jgi:hydroxymethylbilane synthase
MNPPNKLRIVSRQSKLALCQANQVKQTLNMVYPQIHIEIIPIATRGDNITNFATTQIGGKGVFTHELEMMLIEKSADLAVHSAKDMSVNLSSQFSIACFLEREDVRDVLISNKYNSLAQIPPNSVIGSASNRRKLFLNKYYPQLQMQLLRGNVITRLNKLDNEQYAGIILAAAGLKRLNLADKITQYLPPEQFIPALGQGALAVEVLSNNHNLIELLQPLNHHYTKICLNVERHIGKIIGLNCGAPVAIYAKIANNIIYVVGYIANQHLECKVEKQAPLNSWQELANNCAQELITQGARNILG